jgi:quaternary ammonium compound-resistance protein SugE
VIALSLSTYFLAVASRDIPISIAYAIWFGIGTIGTLAGSMIIFNEKFSTMHACF